MDLDFDCPVCHSKYRLKRIKLPAPNKGSIDCEVCGALIRSWEDTSAWMPILLMRGTPPPASTLTRRA
jgi:hypothetical protein